MNHPVIFLWFIYAISMLYRMKFPPFKWNQETNYEDGDIVEEREELKWARAVLMASIIHRWRNQDSPK